MTKKIDRCPGGMPIQKGKEPVKNGATFPVLDGTPFGAVPTGDRVNGQPSDICGLEHVSENSTMGSGSWTIGCRRCRTCYFVKNLAR